MSKHIVNSLLEFAEEMESIGHECEFLEEAATEIMRLRVQVSALEAERDKWHDIAINLAEALAFYADPDSYFAIAIMADRPCGEFADDVSKDETYGRHMPGAKARAALANAALREGGE